MRIFLCKVSKKSMGDGDEPARFYAIMAALISLSNP